MSVVVMFVSSLEEEFRWFARSVTRVDCRTDREDLVSVETGSG